MIVALFHEFHHWLEMKRVSQKTNFSDYPLHSLLGQGIDVNRLPASMSDEEKRVEMRAQYDFMEFQATQPILHRWVALFQKAQNIH